MKVSNLLLTGLFISGLLLSPVQAKHLHKRAGIVLIMENPEKDIYYLQRVIKLAKKYKIDVWTMKDLTDFESIAYKRRGLKLWKR